MYQLWQKSEIYKTLTIFNLFLTYKSVILAIIKGTIAAATDSFQPEKEMVSCTAMPAGHQQ